MTAEPITVSYVVTVYNKAPYIGQTAASLRAQAGDFTREFIFVDDVSSDNSLEVLEAAMQGEPNVTIIRNNSNAGPAVRVNQGAKLARGEFLFFIDSDDILAVDATKRMLELAQEHDVAYVHGGWEKTGIEGHLLQGRKLPANAPYSMSRKPLEFIFRERLRRMSQLVRRDVFLEAGGCDERVFIQDESLPLRVARVASGMIRLNAPVLLIPKIEGELSRNVSQLNHDRFLAHRNMLLDFPELDETACKELYRECVSCFWKQQRLMRGAFMAMFSGAFIRYISSKARRPDVDLKLVNDMSVFFANLPGVRRAG